MVKPDDQDEPADPLAEEKLRHAMEMPPAEKFIAGARLFDYAAAVTMAGIRSQFPGRGRRAGAGDPAGAAGLGPAARGAGMSGEAVLGLTSRS